MPRKEFDGELTQLHEYLGKMCEIIEGMITDAVASLKSMDREKGAAVSDADKTVDELENAVEKLCVRLLLKQQPVAKDLVRVTTALKIITDFERIGDQASDIGEMVAEYPSEHTLPESDALRRMGEIAVSMVSQSMDAFLGESVEGADAVIRADSDMDNLLISINADIIKIIRNDNESADGALSLLMTAKHLEKIGDYAVNVARWAKYVVTGTHPDKKLPG